jgi:uncharacterized SAM-binding protein YcdF (DUF218 family)
VSLLVRLVPLLVLAQLAALILAWRRARREGRRPPRLLAAVSLAVFLAFWPPVSWLSVATLEAWYSTEPRPEDAAEGGAEAYVVLSGAVYQPRSYRPVPQLGFDTYVRCRHAAWLYKHWRVLPVIVCGGPNDPRALDHTLAAAMVEYLELEGVPSGEVWVEDRSRTTHENALFAAEILRAKGIERVVLVTEAYHMLRSELSFRKQGLEVVPAPCGFHAAEFQPSWRMLVPNYQALVTHEHVFHEWVGLVWYWLRGRL